MKALALIPALLAVLAGPAWGQRRPNASPETSFTADARVVLVPATVLTRQGALVGGLSPDAFTILQDNVPRPIVSFGEEDVPVSIVIVLDVSSSMQPVLGDARDTLRAFLNVANPEDEARLLTVSSRPAIDAGFTQDLGSLLSRAMFLGAGGSTALIDTIYAGLSEMRAARQPRRAMLIISDGMDNHSRYSAGELMSRAVEADVQIYSVSYFNAPPTRKAMELREEMNGVAFLAELARRTGGVQIVARDRSQITEAATRIGRIMRDQYLLGFVPGENSDRDRWHTIRVSVKDNGTKAYARSGFYIR